MMNTERHTFTGPIFLGKDLDFVEEGFVVIEGEKIIDCGEGKVGGGKKRSIIPAFINAHTHTGDHLLREKCYGMSLEDACGARGAKSNVMSSASEEHIISGMKSAISQMVHTGTCYFTDFREGGIQGIRQLEKALLAFKYRGVKAKIFGRPLYSGEEFLDECDGYGARSIRGEKVAMRAGRSLGIHVCEAKSGELERALEFRPDFLVHMNSATGDEIKKAASSKLPVIVCPRSNKYFGLQMPDISMMLEEGILVSLGTDNSMANSLSMMSEMEFTARMTMKDDVSAKDILKMATVNPAKVFGWRSGYIEKGADANILLFSENFLKTPEPYATAILRMGAEKYDVMFGGKFVEFH